MIRTANCESPSSRRFRSDVGIWPGGTCFCVSTDLRHLTFSKPFADAYALHSFHSNILASFLILFLLAVDLFAIGVQQTVFCKRPQSLANRLALATQIVLRLVARGQAVFTITILCVLSNVHNKQMVRKLVTAVSSTNGSPMTNVQNWCEHIEIFITVKF